MKFISVVTGLSQLKVSKKVALLPKKVSGDVPATERSDLKTNWEQLAANISLYEPMQSAFKSAVFADVKV